MPPPPSRQLQNNSSTNNENTKTTPLTVERSPPEKPTNFNEQSNVHETNNVNDDNRKLAATQNGRKKIGIRGKQSG